MMPEPLARWSLLLLSGLLLPVLGTGCWSSQAATSAGRTKALHGPVSDELLVALNKRSLGKMELARVLAAKGVRISRTPPAAEMRMPFRMINGVPRIECRVNDRKSIPFIFDTGASHSMLNAADAVKLKVLTLRADAGAVPMVGVIGKEQGRFGMIETLALGDWRVRGYPCVVRTHQNGIQTGAATRFFQPNLLGFDLAAEACSYLTVDYLKRELVYGFGGVFSPPTGPRVAKAPFKLVMGGPVTRVSIDDQQWDALIDTGSFNGIEVGTRLAERLGIQQRSKPVEGLAVFGVGGTMSSSEAGLRVATVPQLQACGMSHREVEVDIAPGPARIGSFFLKDYRMTIDLRRKVIWLER